MAASAVAPLTPILLPQRLRARGRMGNGERVGVCGNTRFERRAAYSSDCSVVLPLMPSARAAPPWGPSLLCERLRAPERRFLRVSMGADTKANAWAAAHFRLVIIVSLRMAASAEAPSSPTLFQARLRARGGAGMMGEQACQRALTRKRTLGGGGALEVSDLRILEDGGECSGTLLSDVVGSETASEG